MKEIKAYMRRALLDSTIKELEAKGARDITVTNADAIGDLSDFEMDRWHMLRKYQETYSSTAKLELVCRDDEVRPFIDVIKQHGHTGERGDGRVFVTPVDLAANIRTGEEGDDAL